MCLAFLADTHKKTSQYWKKINMFFLLEDYGTPTNDFEDTTNNSNQVTSTDVSNKDNEDSITVSINIISWLLSQ